MDVSEDDADESLEQLITAAETLLDRPYRSDWTKSRAEEEVEVEIIEGLSLVTVLIEAPRSRLGEFTTTATGVEVSVQGPDFRIKKPLPCRVVPSSLVSELRNGVYSVKLVKE